MTPTFLAFPNDEAPWLLTRAYMAAIVGPSRVVGTGQTRKVPGPLNTGQRLSRASGDQVLFVQVRLTAGQSIALGPSNDLGAANSTFAAAGFINQVLLPGEEIWGMNLGPTVAEFVVTEVRF